MYLANMTNVKWQTRRGVITQRTPDRILACHYDTQDKKERFYAPDKHITAFENSAAATVLAYAQLNVTARVQVSVVMCNDWLRMA